jgi:hypothetical protein
MRKQAAEQELRAVLRAHHKRLRELNGPVRALSFDCRRNKAAKEVIESSSYSALHFAKRQLLIVQWS